jgi:hypothetical protein
MSPIEESIRMDHRSRPLLLDADDDELIDRILVDDDHAAEVLVPGLFNAHYFV